MQDVVDRLTPLGVMVLALLGEGDMHPYEMIRLMRHPPRRPARRDHERHDVPHGRPARAGGAARRGRRRSRGQPPRAHHLRGDGCRSARRHRMGAPRARPRRPPRRVPHRARRGAQPRSRRGHLAPAHPPRRAAAAQIEVAAGLERRRREGACPTQYLLELEREHVAAGGATSSGSIASSSDSRATEFPWGAHEPSERYLEQTKGRTAMTEPRQTPQHPRAASRSTTVATPRRSAAARGRPSGRSSSGSS